MQNVMFIGIDPQGVAGSGTTEGVAPTGAGGGPAVGHFNAQINNQPFEPDQMIGFHIFDPLFGRFLRFAIGARQIRDGVTCQLQVTVLEEISDGDYSLPDKEKRISVGYIVGWRHNGYDFFSGIADRSGKVTDLKYDRDLDVLSGNFEFVADSRGDFPSHAPPELTQATKVSGDFKNGLFKVVRP